MLNDRPLESYAAGRRRRERAASYSTKYDRELHKRISSWFERRAIRRALAVTGVRDGRVLDVPCGAGRLTPLLRPVASELLSCDYSPAMLEFFRSAHPEPCFVASAFELPFPDRSFDLVFSARLAHHIAADARRADYLRSVLRISRRWAIVTVFDRDSLKNRLRERRRRRTGKRGKYTFSAAEVAAIARSAGFEVAASIPLSRLGSGHVFHVLERRVRNAEPFPATEPRPATAVARQP